MVCDVITNSTCESSCIYSLPKQLLAHTQTPICGALTVCVSGTDFPRMSNMRLADSECLRYVDKQMRGSSKSGRSGSNNNKMYK